MLFNAYFYLKLVSESDIVICKLPIQVLNKKYALNNIVIVTLFRNVLNKKKLNKNENQVNL